MRAPVQNAPLGGVGAGPLEPQREGAQPAPFTDEPDKALASLDRLSALSRALATRLDGSRPTRELHRVERTDLLRAVRAAVPDLPLIANGDVLDAASARRAEALSGADAVMVGRGAQGAPWRLAQIAHELHGTPAPVVPQGAALAEAVAAHHDDILSHYGRDLGLRVARKHLGWYADAAGLPDPQAARAALMAAASPAAAAAAINGVRLPPARGFAGAPWVAGGMRLPERGRRG